MFELIQAAKRYDGAWALRPTDLALRAGETLALIGPSGAGKSTALRVMAGLVRLDHGSVRFAGRDVAEADWPEVRRRCGYVIQDGGLFPHLTAGDNVALMARHLGWPAARAAARLAELAELARLDDGQLARFPSQLSGGQRQRVALMRALMLDPAVLLLDEPLSALDPITRHDLAQELKEIFAKLGKTVVIVTHALAEARFFAHRVVLMRDGGIVQDGSAEDLEDNPADPFVGRFLAAERSLG